MKFISSITLSILFSTVAGAQSLPAKKVPSKEMAAPTETKAEAPSASSGGGMRFRTDDDSKTGSSKPSVNFYVPNNEEEKNRITADPVNEIFNDSPYKIALGFPRWDFSFSYDPQNFALTQKLNSGMNPSFSGLSTTAYSILTRLNVDLTQFWELEYSTFDAKAKYQAPSGVSSIGVNESTSTPTAIMVRGFYCWVGTFSSRRLCVGGEMGSDSTPTLSFVGTSALEMNKITDYLIGPSMIYQYPVSERVTLHGKLGYLLGTAVGQNSTLAVKSDSKLLTEVGLKVAFNDRHGVTALVNYHLRNAKVEGYQGANLVGWDVGSSSMAGKLAYVLSF